MGKIILLIIAVVIALIGAYMIYDARSLTKKWFGFGDQNEATAGMKILGFVFVIIGFLVIYFNIG